MTSTTRSRCAACPATLARGSCTLISADCSAAAQWTEVVKGTRSIFRNVFVRELHEIRVPGMAEWYKKMEKEGGHFHYVSNSPLELWPVLRAFLVLAGFPSGSCTLKEYGGASSALAKLWEEPGQRKRANVEVILREFPESQFILIGDSGEQDLELYVSLAQQYPRNVLAIYIRDVTTPFDTAPRAPTTSSSTSSKSSRAPAPPPEVTWGHSHSASDLASLVEEEQRRGRDGRSEDVVAFSEMPDLPGQFDGSHERPVLPRRKSGSEATVTSSSTAASAAPPIPPRPSLGKRTHSSPRASAKGLPPQQPRRERRLPPAHRRSRSRATTSSRTTLPTRSRPTTRCGRVRHRAAPNSGAKPPSRRSTGALRTPRGRCRMGWC